MKANVLEESLDPNEDRSTLKALYSGDFDFLDFGCSRGGSIELANRMFGEGRGLGLDIDPQKVALTKESGHAALVADLTRFTPKPDLVRYVMMSHMLEHLPGLSAAEQTIACGVNAARDFVFISQPWFDSDGYLFRKGLKLYWSDWRGHPNRMTCLQFHYVLEKLRRARKVIGYSIFARNKIHSSLHRAIHPLSSPSDQHAHEERKHPAKDRVPVLFTEPVYSEIQVLVSIRPNDSLSKFRRVFPGSKYLFGAYD